MLYDKIIIAHAVRILYFFQLFFFLFLLSYPLQPRPMPRRSVHAIPISDLLLRSRVTGRGSPGKMSTAAAAVVEDPTR